MFSAGRRPLVPALSCAQSLTPAARSKLGTDHSVPVLQLGGFFH
jgi:hypothetical protein